MYNSFFPRKVLLFFFLSTLLSSSCTKQGPGKLIIATAANMQFTMEELVANFSAETQIPCEIVISSSGKLTAQIKAGAPFHLFVSADQKYPETLHKEGFTLSPPQTYAYGQLVLWQITGHSQPTLEKLKNPDIQHIAIANPKTAPYGVAAEQVLKTQALFDTVAHKLVYGESIAQTNQFIISGAAEIGFTALSVVKSKVATGQGKWALLPEESYAPIAQAAVALKSHPEMEEKAQTFIEFLHTEQASEILGRFGYLVRTKNE